MNWLFFKRIKIDDSESALDLIEANRNKETWSERRSWTKNYSKTKSVGVKKSN